MSLTSVEVSPILRQTSAVREVGGLISLPFASEEKKKKRKQFQSTFDIMKSSAFNKNKDCYPTNDTKPHLFLLIEYHIKILPSSSTPKMEVGILPKWDFLAYTM